MCKTAITFLCQKIRIENIDFRVLRKIPFKKKYVLNLSKFCSRLDHFSTGL